MSTISLAYAANRQIGLECLQVLIEAELLPSVLLLPENGDRNDEMTALLPNVPVSIGKTIDPALLKNTDLLLSIHFPHIITKDVLALPKIGTLNLHPAFLPWNRGWHTPSWAIIDDTPFGATLHWIDEGVDTGPIALQKRVEILPEDTAHTLYGRALTTEIAMLREAIPLIKTNTLPKSPQKGTGTRHDKKDLVSVQKLDENMTLSQAIKIIRGLTTNVPEESAYFEQNGKHYHIRATITEK